MIEPPIDERYERAAEVMAAIAERDAERYRMSKDEFITLIDAYWNAAYSEGKRGATCDTPDYRAGKINTALMRHYDALQRERDEAVALLRYVCSLHPDDCGCSGCKFAFLAKREQQ